jgi:hypothetical protein
MMYEKEIKFFDEVALDTIVVPAHPKGFEEVFLGEKRWPNLKIDQKRKAYVRFIAVYQTRPVSTITHYVEVERFDPLEQKGRYTVIFKGEPKGNYSPPSDFWVAFKAQARVRVMVFHAD